MISGEAIKWGAVGVQVVFSQAHNFVGVQIKDIHCATIIHYQAVDVTIGDLSCDHQGISLWVMDLSCVDFSKNYIFKFPLCLLIGSYFRFVHLYWVGIFCVVYVFFTCMVTFF